MFVSEVQSALVDSGIDPAWLGMEITERVVLNTNEIAERMAELAKMGIRFAIDDFGTEYSSLQHLHRLPISSLKIDCSHPSALRIEPQLFISQVGDRDGSQLTDDGHR
jgi:EAL domain-containing protein (putative c-di-GMP-specific phosphodiesterase class I)